MGNRPLPKITCPKCQKTQNYRGQKKCIHGGCEWTNWDIAVQLGRPATVETETQTNNRFDRR